MWEILDGVSSFDTQPVESPIQENNGPRFRPVKSSSTAGVLCSHTARQKAPADGFFA
jgi:hypothetical protein